jgi:hypothetical protein
MTELAEKLPWRDELEQLEDRLKFEDLRRLLGYRFPGIDAEHHADRLIDGGDLPKKALEDPEKTRADLILGLERAALYYWLGQSVGEVTKHNATMKSESRALGLKLPPEHRPECYENRTFIWAMAVTWEHFGGKVGTASRAETKKKVGAETPGRFQRFCATWLEQIDPEHEMPGREKYRQVMKRAEGAGAIARPHLRRSRPS